MRLPSGVCRAASLGGADRPCAGHLGRGEMAGERAAVAGHAADLHARAVAQQHVLDDGQAEAGAAGVGVAAGIDAVEHVLKVASSIDSLVVGEREIITQVRQSYEQSKELGLSGDFIRVFSCKM